MRSFQNIIVTGGAGFIGANFIHYLFSDNNFNGNIINVDKLTYAGKKENLKDIEKTYVQRYFFEQCDICNKTQLQKIFNKYNVDAVIHFAAESHVDRSIDGAQDFIQTNIIGTFTLLEIARNFWAEKENTLFHHVSTDEVFGSIESGSFYETSRYNPRNPYSASKASSDHLVRSYFSTYNFPITMSHCSNNFGPYQFPEKFIPVIIQQLNSTQNIPVYGNGTNVRDWIYVADHCSAIWKIVQYGELGETYNIGGENEKSNIELVELICSIFSKIYKKPIENFTKYINFVTDRKGHDQRYAINCDKIKTCLGWQANHKFEDAIMQTIEWYLILNKKA